MRFIFLSSFLLCLIAFKTFSLAVEEKDSLRWVFKTKQPIIGSPALNEGVIFFGGTDSVFYAVELSSGKLKWKIASRGQIRSTACFFNNLVIFNGGDGVIYAVDKQTGKINWTFATQCALLGERRYDPADYFDSSPVVYKNTVLVGSSDNYLYCLDAASGKKIWSFRAGDIIHTTPVIAKDKIVFGASDGLLYCLNVAGNLNWKFKSVGHRNFPKGEMQGSPVVSGNLVFIGSRDYNLYAIDLFDGYCHWNKQFPNGWATALTADDSTLFVGTSDDKVFLKLDPETGAERWRFNARMNIFGPPVLSKEDVCFATHMGKTFVLSRKTGTEIHQFNTTSFLRNGGKYFKDDLSFSEHVYTTVKGFSDYLALLYDIGAIYSTPIRTSDALVVTSSDGGIYCFSVEY